MLAGLGTSVIQKATGAYSTKLVLRFGEIYPSTRFIEVGIGSLRETRKCPSGGWPFKLKTETAQGTDTVAWKAKCGGGGGGGGADRP